MNELVFAPKWMLCDCICVIWKFAYTFSISNYKAPSANLAMHYTKTNHYYFIIINPMTYRCVVVAAAAAVVLVGGEAGSVCLDGVCVIALRVL